MAARLLSLHVNKQEANFTGLVNYTDVADSAGTVRVVKK